MEALGAVGLSFGLTGFVFGLIAMNNAAATAKQLEELENRVEGLSETVAQPESAS